MSIIRPHKEAIRHGGGLLAASNAHPEVAQPWLDLSTGINPSPYPGTPATVDARGKLPDPLELAGLEQVAATFFGARPERVAAASGAETVIRLLPTLMGRVTVDIVGPTYGAHAESWHAAHVAPHIISTSDVLKSRADVLVIVNPNNPDGHVFSRLELEAILRQCEASGRWLVIDESFGECAPHTSMADRISDKLVVLRSFGKFFGLAGVRLGFAISSPQFKASLRSLTGDWPVSADAIAMGSQAYADKLWVERTNIDLQRRTAQLDVLLQDAGFQILGGTSLFRLTRHPAASQWFWTLCRRGILTRPFEHSPDNIRFGVPREIHLSRFASALRAGL